MRRSRLKLAVATLVVVALGLACRTSLAPALVQKYLGDVLWGALFFLLLAGWRPAMPWWRLALGAAATTELIELSQLYREPWADALRATRLGGLLLGRGFSWSDVICVALGAGLAGMLDGQTWLRSVRD